MEGEEKEKRGGAGGSWVVSDMRWQGRGVVVAGSLGRGGTGQQTWVEDIPQCWSRKRHVGTS